MANTREVLTDRFLALNGAGKRQSAQGTPMLNADLDTREKCTIAREEVVARKEYRDCQNVYFDRFKIDTRFARWTLTYSEGVTPQQITRWTALKEGAAIAPSGSPANEVVTLARSGPVSAGSFPVTVSLEGRTVTSKPIPYNATAAQIQAALTAARMNFIHPGDVVVESGVKQVETLTVVGTANESEDLAVTVTAANSVALVSGKTIQVAIADTDTAAIVAGKIRAALIADADIGHVTTGFFTITGAGAEVILTARTAVANDGTMAAAYENAHGMTGATSANTTAGVAENDWAGGMRVIFQGRLAGVNMPNLSIDNTNVIGGTITATQTTAGEQRLHAITRSTARQKAFFSAALGWLDDLDRVEKFIDIAVESVSASLSLEGQVGLTVTLLSPWEYDSIETAFDIPQCLSIEPLESNECRIFINDEWLTVDMTSLAAAINDAIPTDKLSMFPFDGMDVQTVERGRQPVDGPITGSFFGSEVDPIYQLAQNERTADYVPVLIHFGFPGNRCSWIFDNSQIRFQTNRSGEAGEARYSTVNIEAHPTSQNGAVPFECEAYLSQSTAFLAT